MRNAFFRPWAAAATSISIARPALDGSGIGALTALNESLLEQLLRIGELGNAEAGGAFAAEVVAQTFTSGGLREHARQREFAQTAWPSEEQRVGDASAAESAPQRSDNAFVAEKFRKAHGQPLWPGSRAA